MPIPLTFTLAQQSRAAGDHVIGPNLVPAGTGYTNIEAQLNLPTVDYENTANQIIGSVYVSPDLGVTWNLICQTIWKGGRVVRGGVTNPPPRLGCGFTPYVGQQMKTVFNLNNVMTVGMTVTVS